ncbi:MAG: hemerythrin domain-containing protein [Sandaracinus sp.]
MAIALGRAPRAIAETPEALLLACHEKMRTFAARARSLAAMEPRAESDVEVSEEAAAIARYFGESLALHVRDEEESILPRLVGRSPALDRALEAMEQDHAEHEPWLQALVHALGRIAEQPQCLREEQLDLATAAREVEDRLRVHLAAEEATVLPALGALSETERLAILREIRARRRPA